MNCKQCVSETFKLCDLFSLTQFLRYKQDEDYKTVSGGVVSLLVITIFCVLFAGNAISTINKTAITWERTEEYSFDPSKTTMTFDAQNKNLLTVGMLGVDLNDPNIRYFDYQLVQKTVAGGIFIDLRITDLVPCTIQHFGLSQKIKQSYSTIRAHRRLCPPLGYSFDIFGKITSQTNQMLDIRVNQCSNASSSSVRCANQTEVDSLIARLGRIRMGFFFVNPLINAGSEEYLDYYIEDKNVLSFTTTLGVASTVKVQDYTIQTDQSLLPFTQTRVQKGLTIPQVFINTPYLVYNHQYASLSIMKSSTSVLYKRSFSKIDQFFSYVGGLIGTILGLMLFMSNFSLMAFELDIAHKYFKYNQEQNNNFTNFNLFSYFSYLLFKFGSFCGLCKSWKEMKIKVKCRNEMVKQLDIKLFLMRFNFLERAVDKLLKSKGDLPQLYSLQTFKDLRARRKKYSLMRKKNDEDESGDEDSSDSEDETPSKKIGANSQLIDSSEQQMRARTLSNNFTNNHEKHERVKQGATLKEWNFNRDVNSQGLIVEGHLENANVIVVKSKYQSAQPKEEAEEPKKEDKLYFENFYAIEQNDP